MLKTLLFLLILSIQSFISISQQAYRVYLTDKGNQQFDPYTFFDEKALLRREHEHLPIYDVTDLPVFKEYIDCISRLSDSISVCSRWFNFVKVYISSDKQYYQIKSLPFVLNIEESLPVKLLECSLNQTTDDNNLLTKQTQRMGSKYFKEKGFDGTGIRIAIFDGGFPEVNTHEAFAHIRNSGRLLKTWDFTKNKEFVYYSSSHGRQTFACVGGIYDSINIGLATGSEYLLALTEVGSEPFQEEEWWLAAAEWADQNGADIISSSLGYGHQRYFTSDMDGNTSLVVKAAEMAVRKGILVVNSAGNEADKKWKGIITPSDGDSVLAVGGIDPNTDYHIEFSSYGPTADKRLKPNVSAYGHVITAGKNGITSADGTSFSCPLVSGFAACAWQAKPELTVMELFHELEKSGHLYPYYDYAHGYGIPQAAYFTNQINENIETFEVIDSPAFYTVVIKPARFNNTDWLQDMNLLYYHYADAGGYLSSSEIIAVESVSPLVLQKANFKEGDIVRIHFRGHTKTINF